MPMSAKKILNSVAGSGISQPYLVENDRVDVHINFRQAGGLAKVVVSADGQDFAPIAGLPEYTDSIVQSLDLAENTYLAIEHVGVTELSASVKPYRYRQL